MINPLGLKLANKTSNSNDPGFEHMTSAVVPSKNTTFDKIEDFHNRSIRKIILSSAKN